MTRRTCSVCLLTIFSLRKQRSGVHVSAQFLKSKFSIGSAKHVPVFLGLNIHQDLVAGLSQVMQETYTNRILQKFASLRLFRPCTTPLPLDLS